MLYRPEIDGLRAVAVLLVLLFHSKLPYVSGGFVGVDVFFVISGYLIASLILEEHNHGRGSVVRFYERRLRRILPAFLLVLVSVLTLGTIFLLPDDLANLASSTVAASTFLANRYFAQHVDYFQDQSGAFPLLHVWSLSVEGQFYVAAPLALLLLHRYAPRHVPAGIGAACCAAAALSVYGTLYWPESVFFSSAARSFELLVGVRLAYMSVAKQGSALETLMLPIAGLGMIVAAAVLYDENTPFPGLAAFLPCGGAALIVAFAHPNIGLGRSLSGLLPVYLGRISYPLYLWHWPLLILSSLYFVRDLSAIEIALVYGIAMLLAIGTHLWLERPIKAFWPRLGSRMRWAWLAAALSLVMIGASAISFGNGLPGRVPPEVRALLKAEERGAWFATGCHNLDRGNSGFLERCSIGTRGAMRPTFAVWGDSMANSLSPMISEIAEGRQVGGVQLSHAGCPPLLDVAIHIRHKPTACKEQNNMVLGLLSELKVRRVILVANWGWYSQGRAFKIAGWPVALYGGSTNAPQSLEQTLLTTTGLLREKGFEVAIVGPIPEVGWSPARVLAMEAWRHTKLANEQTHSEFLAWQSRVMDALRTLQLNGEATVVYPHKHLCDAICLVHERDEIFYADPEHMTRAGLLRIKPALEELFAGFP